MGHKYKININKVAKSRVETIAKYKRDQAAQSGIVIKEKSEKKLPALTPENKEELMREIAKRRSILEQEMHSLNVVRNSLVWLLDKAVALETMRNHQS